jgi:hypothetical protein
VLDKSLKDKKMNYLIFDAVLFVLVAPLYVQLYLVGKTLKSLARKTAKLVE